MKYILVVIFFLCCFSLSEAHKAKNHNRKKMKDIRAELDGLDAKIAKLVEDTNRILECLNTSKSDPNWSNVCVTPEESRSLDRTDIATSAGETSADYFPTLLRSIPSCRRGVCGQHVHEQRGSMWLFGQPAITVLFLEINCSTLAIQ